MPSFHSPTDLGEQGKKENYVILQIIFYTYFFSSVKEGNLHHHSLTKRNRKQNNPKNFDGSFQISVINPHVIDPFQQRSKGIFLWIQLH